MQAPSREEGNRRAAATSVWRLGVGRTFQITATFTSMTVLENVQTVLLSYHGRLRSLLPWSTSHYVDEAFAFRAGRYG